MVDASAVMAIREAERALYEAMVARDFVALERMLAADLVYVHSTAVAESRQEYLAGVAQGRYEYESVASHDVRVRVYGAMALSDGVCEMRVGAGGGPKALIRLLFVLVWCQRANGWQLTHRHATRLPAAAT